ncbi:msx2-interacting protein-like [Watersipora subatra]|uniref:msx2-interacting protein-like n=1 Tax=Watersipora subatra TaxID=2589382 RepID=UPI00355B0640
MVRESRYIKVGLIPSGTTEKSVCDHFGKYGKVQSVRLEDHTECLDAVVAFTDIKAASQAYNEDQLLDGAVPLSIAFCDAAGTTQSERKCPTLPPLSAVAEDSVAVTADNEPGVLVEKEG